MNTKENNVIKERNVRGEKELRKGIVTKTKEKLRKKNMTKERNN